ncbi:MAG: DUF448 domain-containing protein [Magnetococcales bacterium]|nr:DUF448 domain-containing protein [Magnetococcales bacterium]
MSCPRERLLRFVRAPEGTLVEDVAGRLPGRGLYVWPTAANVERLLKKHGSGGALETLVQRCGVALSRRFLDGLGLARRAGVVQRGVRELEELLQTGRRPLVIVAEDISDNTRQKVTSVVRRYAWQGEWLELLDSESLGSACGWSPSVVLAIHDAGLEHRIQTDALRWLTFYRDRAWDGG